MKIFSHLPSGFNFYIKFNIKFLLHCKNVTWLIKSYIWDYSTDFKLLSFTEENHYIPIFWILKPQNLSPSKTIPQSWKFLYSPRLTLWTPCRNICTMKYCMNHTIHYSKYVSEICINYASTNQPRDSRLIRFFYWPLWECGIWVFLHIFPPCKLINPTGYFRLYEKLISYFLCQSSF